MSLPEDGPVDVLAVHHLLQLQQLEAELATAFARWEALEAAQVGDSLP